MSPRVVKERGYIIAVFTDDLPPAHVHAIKDGKMAKFFLQPVSVYEAGDFSDKMIREAIEIIRNNKGHCWNIWHEVHGL